MNILENSLSMCLKRPVENIYGINRHQIEKTQNDHIYICIDRYVLGTLYNSENEWSARYIKWMNIRNISLYVKRKIQITYSIIPFI